LKREMNFNFLKLSNRAVLRKENFGGILFNKDTGDVIEVDREAFIILSIVKAAEVVDMKTFLELPISHKGRRIGRKSIAGIISSLIDLGIIEVMPKGILSYESYGILKDNSRMMIKWPANTHMSAPETVHWAFTFKCGEACPDCYIERHKGLFARELDTQEAFIVIDKIASAGVFQLAIGGGEPLLRDDLEIIAGYASEKGLTVHITTGNYKIERRRLDELAKHIKTLFGIDWEKEI